MYGLLKQSRKIDSIKIRVLVQSYYDEYMELVGKIKLIKEAYTETFLE